MISHLSGVLLYKNERLAVVDVRGVGYQVWLGKTTVSGLPALQSPISLWVHQVVREDAMELFGFMTRAELEFFQLLISISGVGPKSALGILSLAPPDILSLAIAEKNLDYLTKVSGIGKKLAEKIVLELKDKLLDLPVGKNAQELGKDTDALLALQALGYSLPEARQAIKDLPTDCRGDTSLQIKEALKILAKQ